MQRLVPREQDKLFELTVKFVGTAGVSILKARPLASRFTAIEGSRSTPRVVFGSLVLENKTQALPLDYRFALQACGPVKEVSRRLSGMRPGSAQLLVLAAEQGRLSPAGTDGSTVAVRYCCIFKRFFGLFRHTILIENLSSPISDGARRAAAVAHTVRVFVDDGTMRIDLPADPLDDAGKAAPDDGRLRDEREALAPPLETLRVAAPIFVRPMAARSGGGGGEAAAGGGGKGGGGKGGVDGQAAAAAAAAAATEIGSGAAAVPAVTPTAVIVRRSSIGRIASVEDTDAATAAGTGGAGGVAATIVCATLPRPLGPKATVAGIPKVEATTTVASASGDAAAAAAGRPRKAASGASAAASSPTAVGLEWRQVTVVNQLQRPLVLYPYSNLPFSVSVVGAGGQRQAPGPALCLMSGDDTTAAVAAAVPVAGWDGTGQALHACGRGFEVRPGCPVMLQIVPRPGAATGPLPLDAVKLGQVVSFEGIVALAHPSGGSPRTTPIPALIDLTGAPAAAAGPGGGGVVVDRANLAA
ncbi:unnamed protein product, partial [Phaeothamnion confervicola]